MTTAQDYADEVILELLFSVIQDSCLVTSAKFQ